MNRTIPQSRLAAVKLALLALTAVASLCSFGRASASGEGDDQKKAAPPRYEELVLKSYDLRFGQNPFAPSNATSTTGTFIPGSKFLPASRCANCHGDAHAQWRQSAHGNAFREPFYQRNVKDIIAQKNIAYTRHCESCHNPAALFSGVLTDKPAFKQRPFDEDGVSCIACHSIQDVNRRGIGGYVMGEPALLVKEDGTRLLEGVTDQQILDNVNDHRRAMMRALLKVPESCCGGHKRHPFLLQVRGEARRRQEVPRIRRDGRRHLRRPTASRRVGQGGVHRAAGPQQL